MATWKKKYTGMGLTELKRVKQLEDENRRLKSLVADLALDKHMLQEVLRKGFQSPLRCANASTGWSPRSG